MDLNKTGTMIAALRKEKGLTQKDLADRLGVTDKAISRWETGKGFPDVSLLEPLAKTLEVSITELVNGERTAPETAVQQNDRAVLAALAYTRTMSKTVLAVLLLVFGAGFVIAPMYLAVSQPVWGLSMAGAVFVVAGIMLLTAKKSPSKALARRLSLLALAGALVLEILPGGAVLVFAPGPDRQQVKTFSCFDLTLVGYANFAPFLAAVLTAVAVLLSLLLLRKGKMKLQNAAFVCTVMAGIFFLLPPFFFGGRYMTISGIAITILLFASAGFQTFANRKEE